jgi:membrane protein
VTIFSFLSLFPLILLAVSIAGFVIRIRPDVRDTVSARVADNLPGPLADTVKSAIDTAISSHASIGLAGLGALLITGLGWVGNLRAATEAVWGQAPAARPFLVAKLADLLVLVGLGLGALLSLTLTLAWSTLTSQLLHRVGLAHLPGLGALAKIVGIGLAVAGDALIFGWMMVRLPRARVRVREVRRAAVLAAVGLEILKLIGTYYIARVSQSPTAGLFGSVIGILVWLNLVARYLLLCVAWAAVDHRAASGAAAVAADAVDAADAGGQAASGHRGAEGAGGAALAAASRSRTASRGGAAVSPAAAAAIVFGAGAALGVGAAAARRRRR